MLIFIYNFLPLCPLTVSYALSFCCHSPAAALSVYLIMGKVRISINSGGLIIEIIEGNTWVHVEL